MLLGQHHQGRRHRITTAELKIDDLRVLHTERDEEFEQSSRIEPNRITHSTWLTALLPDEVLHMGKGIKARTIARVDGKDVLHHGNNLHFEIDAELTEDPDDLTKLLLMQQTRRQSETANTFAKVLHEYAVTKLQLP